MDEQLGPPSLNIEMTNIEQRKEKPIILEPAIKRKKSSCKANMLKIINSCHHSLRETRERETTTFEKIIWLIMFTSCLIYCGVLIWRSYWKWSRSSAIVMLKENDDLIREIPFPAVTVCPERKVNIAVFTEIYMNNDTNGDYSEVQTNLLEDLTLLEICDYNQKRDEGRNFSSGNETVGNIKKASMELFQVLSNCVWRGKHRPCDSIFTPILTEDGFCFTFNTIGPEDLFHLENLNTDYEYMDKLNRTRNQGWTLELGYPPDAPRKTFPARGLGTGAKAGLQLKLTEIEAGLDLSCKRRISGFKIILHDPSDLPRPSQQFIRVPTFQEVTVSVTASMKVTSDGLEVFTPQRRRCYFAEERTLKYFKIYSQSNCEYECLVNYTYARCGCVQFGMLHGPDMAICNIGRLTCLDKAEMELSTMDIEESDEAIRIAENCDCLPACTLISYKTAIAQTDLHEDERYSHDFDEGDPIDTPKSKVATAIIFFERPLFDISKRSELYGISDILASCGGLLGLFMGFSVIKIVEILYFCILSVCCRHDAKEFEHSNKQAVQDSERKY